MNVPRSVADVLSDHVVFEVECIDRMYCNVYIPGLQYAAGLVGYVHQQLGLPIASTAPLAKISDRFSAAVHRFAVDQGVPWVDFARSQRKDDVMHEYLAGFTATEGVVFIGRAQEKTAVFRTEKRRNAEGRSYPWIVKSTGMLNRPVSGRMFFEQVIRDNLDIGRPDQVCLVFDRSLRRKGPHPTPGRFRTRVITAGVTPSLHVDYKHTTIKQYHKEGRALRTETTINDTRDFGIGKRLVNLPALREIGFKANRRLLGVQRLDHDPISGARDLHTLTDPVTTAAGTRVPGLKLGQQRSHALL